MAWIDGPPNNNAGIFIKTPGESWELPRWIPESLPWNREPVDPVAKKIELDKMREVVEQYLIESLEKQVKDLKKENRDLKKRLKELESVPSKPAPDRLILI